MKEYLNIVLGSIIGVILTIVWGVITMHFRSKYFAKAIPELKEEVSAMREVQHTIDKENALMSQKMESLDKKMDRFEKQLEEKFEKIDRKMDNLINYLTK